MTYALLGVVAGLTAVVGVLAGAAWWFGKRGFDAMDRYVAEADNAIEMQTELAESRNQQEKTLATLKNVQSERDRHAALIDAMQSQLEQALEQADNDPVATAARIRHTLGRLRDLSAKVSDLSEAAATDDG